MKRRNFIRSTAATAAGAGLFTFLPSTSAASVKMFGANDSIKVGVIGVKGQGFSNMKAMLENEGVECVALCDVDRNILEAREGEVAKLQGDKKPKLYDDYRKLLERKDIDAVIVGTPDHWHCLILTDALAAGKDVWVEKPIANSIEEINIMEKAVQKSDRIVTVGQWQRSDPHFQDAVDFVRSGQLGDIRTVKAWAYMPWDGNFPIVPDEPAPPGVNYDMWLGPAPSRHFNKYRFHWNWRWFWDYAGGLMTDWGVHLLDFALYGMDQYVPNTVISSGGKYAWPGDAKETPDTQYTIYEFDDFGLVWESAIGIGGGNYGRTHGISYIGNKGTLVLDRGGWEVIPETIKGTLQMEAVPLINRTGPKGVSLHATNFVECIRSRKTPNASIEIGAHIARVAQLGNIAYRTGSKVFWDSDSQQFINNDKANELVKAHYREPWKIPSF